MEKKELIDKINNFFNICDESDTWFNKDLVEDALSLLEECKNFLSE